MFDLGNFSLHFIWTTKWWKGDLLTSWLRKQWFQRLQRKGYVLDSFAEKKEIYAMLFNVLNQNLITEIICIQIMFDDNFETTIYLNIYIRLGTEFNCFSNADSCRLFSHFIFCFIYTLCNLSYALFIAGQVDSWI